MEARTVLRYESPLKQAKSMLKKAKAECIMTLKSHSSFSETWQPCSPLLHLTLCTKLINDNKSAFLNIHSWCVCERSSLYLSITVNSVHVPVVHVDCKHLRDDQSFILIDQGMHGLKSVTWPDMGGGGVNTPESGGIFDLLFWTVQQMEHVQATFYL